MSSAAPVFSYSVETNLQRLAERVQQWAENDVQFRPQGKYAKARPPTTYEVKEICRGNMVNVWNFLVNNVHSEQYVDTVRGNLKIHGRKAQQQKDAEQAERRKLLEQRDKLRAAIQETKANIRRLDAEMAEVKKDTIQAEKHNDEVHNTIREYNERAVILDTYDLHSKNTINILNEYTRRLRQLIDKANEAKAAKHQNPASKKSITYFAAGAGGGSNNTNASSRQLEAFEVRFVREICDAIKTRQLEALSSQTASGGVSNNSNIMDILSLSSATKPTTTAAQDAQAFFLSIKSKIQDAPVGPKDLLQGLIEVTRLSIEQIRRESEEHQQQQQSRSTAPHSSSRLTGSGGAGAAGDPSSSVDQLLQEHRNAHIERFMQTQKVLNEVHRLRQQLEAVLQKQREDDEKRIARPRPEDQAKFHELKARERQLASVRAALQFITDKVRELTMMRDKRQQSIMALEEKLNNIKAFEQKNRDKQTTVQNMIIENMSYRRRFEKDREQISRYVSRKVVPPLEELVRDGIAYRFANNRCSEHEITVFTKLPWDYLVPAAMHATQGNSNNDDDDNNSNNHHHVVHMIEDGHDGNNNNNNYDIYPDNNGMLLASKPRRRPLLRDLSLYRLDYTVRGRQFAEQIANILQFPASYQTTEHLLRRVSELKQEVADKESQARLSRSILTAAIAQNNSGSRDTLAINEIIKSCKQQEDMQLNQWLHVVDSVLKETKAALEMSEETKRIAEEWWSQPAQNLVPFVRVNGLNVQEWVAHVKSLQTELSQIMEARHNANSYYPHQHQY